MRDLTLRIIGKGVDGVSERDKQGDELFCGPNGREGEKKFDCRQFGVVFVATSNQMANNLNQADRDS